MRLMIRVDKINYGDVAVKAMPSIRSNAQHIPGVAGEVVAAVSELPDSLLHDIFDAMSEEKKNRIVASLAKEHHDMILSVMNRLSAENKVGVRLADFSVRQDLMIHAEIAELDFYCIVDRCLPILKEQLLSMGGVASVIMKPIIERASADRIMGLLDKFTGGKTEPFLLNLINQNRQALSSVIEEVAQRQNIRLSIRSILIEM